MAFPSLPDVAADEMERRQLALWKEESLFRRTLEANRDGPPFVFYEGPPTANGRPRNWRFTSSGFLIHLGLRRRYDEVPHHSVVFSRDYARNFREIFELRTVPDDPAFYFCRPTATDPGVAPPGHDVLYMLAPVPHLGTSKDESWDARARQLRAHIFRRSIRTPEVAFGPRPS